MSLSVVLRRGLLLACVLLAVSSSAASSVTEQERLVFILQYIGVDYGVAVQDGEVINAFEYAEMNQFVDDLIDGTAALPGDAVSSDLDREMRRLRELIWNHADPDEVEPLARALVTRLTDELGVVAYPMAVPDLERGRRLYALDCAPCHGLRGEGDGFAADWQDPVVTSFNGDRMLTVTAHQVFNASRIGVPGTGMPSYGQARSAEQLWDIAFAVMTLRHDFSPSERPPKSRVTLEQLSRRSSAELLAALRERDPQATLADVDYYRRNPPQATPREP